MESGILKIPYVIIITPYRGDFNNEKGFNENSPVVKSEKTERRLKAALRLCYSMMTGEVPADSAPSCHPFSFSSVLRLEEYFFAMFHISSLFSGK